MKKDRQGSKPGNMEKKKNEVWTEQQNARSELAAIPCTQRGIQ